MWRGGSGPRATSRFRACARGTILEGPLIAGGVCVRAWLLVPSLLLCLASSVAAQVREVPVAFDAAGRVRVVTPALVQRLSLTPPAWPVTGVFAEARLFASGDTFVLAVQRSDGSVDRYALDMAQRQALDAAISTAMAATGRPVTEDRPYDISEPARGAFLRNQMILSAALYMPLAATLSGDGKAGAVIWTLGTGASYFVLSAITKNQSITRAQNHLSTDGALRGLAMSSALLTVAQSDASDDAYVATSLVGALGGAVLGTSLGRKWTDGEAHAATGASTLGALTTLGTLGAVGAIKDNEDNGRLVAGSMLASGVAGYALGVKYPRIAPYRVTSGDVDALYITTAIGVLAGAIPHFKNDPDERALAASLTGGGLAGLLLGERLLARRFDHSEADTWRLWLGAIGGGLMGAGVGILAESNATVGVSLTTVGASAGVWLAHRLISPERASSKR